MILQNDCQIVSIVFLLFIILLLYTFIIILFLGLSLWLFCFETGPCLIALAVLELSDRPS